MQSVNIPSGYNQIMPYLILENPEVFFEFTKNVFDATEKMRHLHENGDVMHGEITIGNSCIMFGGAGGQWTPMTAGLFIYVDDVDECFRKAQEAGGSVVMETTDREYGRTCGLKDPCGNTWWITTAPEK